MLTVARHGECFVLNDGGEVDLDLGNYERYLNITLTRANNITTGKIYQHVIDREVPWPPISLKSGGDKETRHRIC